MTLKPYISIISLVRIVYSLFFHFGSLEKIIQQGQGPIMTPGWGIFYPRGRIYVELQMTLLCIKYTNFVSCCCREDFFMYFHYKSMVDNDMPGAWTVWTPGAPLAAFIKENIIH